MHDTIIGMKHVLTLLACLETEDKIIAIYPFISRELYDLLNLPVTPLGVIQNIFHHMVKAVYFCHSNGVCHRDISLENFLLYDNNIPVLIDFGLAVLMRKSENGQAWDKITHSGQVGKVSYVRYRLASYSFHRCF